MTSVKITCPECKHEFSPDQSLRHQLDHMMQEERNQLQTAFQEKEKSLKVLQNQLQKKESEIDELVNTRISTEKAKLKSELEQKVKADFHVELEGLKEELREKQLKLNKSKELELENERIKREAKEREADILLEAEKKLLKRESEIEAKIIEREGQRQEMKLAEKEKQLSDLRKQLEEARRKAEQGSQKLQGQVQELALEELLKAKFPFDEIQEVKSGVNGADVIHKVKTRNGQECGVIACESKRAINFSEKWIDKLKEDMKAHHADVGIIVTESMPADMTRFGLRKGVWICSFNEVEGLTTVLRESILQIHQVRQSQSGKGEKMELLYEYLCSMEFKHQITGIVEGFSSMKVQLDKEKRAMKGIWKEREKQIDRVMDNTLNMYGSIRGIAGKSVIQIDLLEIESPHLLQESEK